jgi:sec-independent protein translocase protein TatA
MDLGPMELGLILLGFLVLFGYNRLPDASRSLGRSLRIFKGEMRGLQEDGRTSAPEPREPDLEEQLRAAEAAAAQARARANAARAAVTDAPR